MVTDLVQSKKKKKCKNAIRPLCVLHRGSVVYGHCCGFTVGAKLLQVVFLHAAQLGPGELEGVLEGRVGVAHTAGHGRNPQITRRHVALTQGRPHFLPRF